MKHPVRIRVELLSDNLLRFHWTTYDSAGRGRYTWDNLDLSILLRNIAVAAGLERAHLLGQRWAGYGPYWRSNVEGCEQPSGPLARYDT